MYNKNKDFDLHIRINSSDHDFLLFLSSVYDVSVSTVVRQIIGDYRRKYNDKQTDINNKL